LQEVRFLKPSRNTKMKSKEEWQNSCEALKKLSKKMEEDLEEINYTIECYEAKVAQFGQ